MDILNNLQIGDQSIDDKGQVKIMDEDRLCFLVKSESRGTYGLRTISKQLLREYTFAIQYQTHSQSPSCKVSSSTNLLWCSRHRQVV